MKINTIFLTIVVLLFSEQLFSQVDRKNAKFMDTCKLKVISTDSLVKQMPIDSTNRFFICCNCDLLKYRLLIFDRWGTVVLSSYAINDELKFSNIKNGVYFWIIEVEYPNGKKDTKKGTIKIE